MPRYRTPAPADRPAWAQQINEKEARFVRHYATALNAGEAALAAGYGKGSIKTAREIASRLRRRPEIAAAIAQYINDFVGTTRARVLEEIAKIAFADFTDYGTVNPDGTLTIHPHVNLTPDQTAAISSIEEHITERGERTLRVRLYDKGAALALLTRITGMHISRTEISGPGGAPVQVDTTNDVARRVMARLDEIAARQQATITHQRAPLMIDVTPITVPAEVTR